MKEIKIDYLSLTFPLIIHSTQNEIEMVHAVKQMLRDYLKLKPFEVIEEPYATNNYKYQFRLGDFITLRCAGPINDLGYKTCQLELKGEGCRDFERLRSDTTWYEFLSFLDGFTPRYKRIDIAIDDFDGEAVDLSWLYTKLKKGYYSSVFKKGFTPIGNIETGFSMTFGTNNSTTQLCIYDKLLEQAKRGKAVDKNYWVRYEIRFRGDKADSIVNTLMNEYYDPIDDFYGINLKKFAFEALYKILDIKVDNEASKAHQKQCETDPNWKCFIGEVSKADLSPMKPRESNYDKSYNYTSPKMVEIMLMAYIRCHEDSDLFLYSMYEEILEHTAKVSKGKMKRLAKFSKDLGLKDFDEEELSRIRKSIIEKKEMMEVPF